jgi:hypothetical protein
VSPGQFKIVTGVQLHIATESTGVLLVAGAKQAANSPKFGQGWGRSANALGRFRPIASPTS